MFPEANQETSHLVLWAANPLGPRLAHWREGLQSDCVLGAWTRCLHCHPATGRPRGCEGRIILPLEMRRPKSTGTSFPLHPAPHLFLLRMVLPDKKYQRKAQLPSAVPSCEFSHMKLCTGCHDALCYYDRKKWISNVLPPPAAGSLWISVTRHPGGMSLSGWRASTENIIFRLKKNLSSFTLRLVWRYS